MPCHYITSIPGLAPVRPETIYTAREEALITYQGDPHPGPATNFVFSNSLRSFGGAITRTEHMMGGAESFNFKIKSQYKGWKQITK